MPVATYSTLPYPNIAAIVPAYNEAGRIGQVLAVLHQVDWLREIIVVDDGSTDSTAAEVGRAMPADPRLRLIRHSANRGKGAALLSGAQATRCPILLFLDADLVGLKPEHIRALVEPVVQNRAAMTLGLFWGGQLHTDLAHRLTPWLTGQRCLRAALLEDVYPEAMAGYGIETAISLAARRRGWPVQRVALPGVSHTIGELQSGFRSGFHTRLKMYSHILKAWRLERRHSRRPGPRARTRPLMLRMLAVLVIVLALFFSDRSYNLSRAASPLRLADIPALPLQNARRLLVIAPHPDDEALGAAGAIQAALAAGVQVKVVIMTNGDGQWAAPLVLDRRLMPRRADYIADGEQRQAESLLALQTLGLPASSVLFLGYPDGRLNRLWESDWTSDCPWPAPYTRATHSPYPLTFNPQATYCGRDVLGDLRAIIAAYRPGLVLLPHPNDDHPDHRAASNFARLALALTAAADPAYQPAMWGYLIHFGYYPQPRGLHVAAALLPPTPLSRQGIEWARLDLTPAQVRLKTEALQAYASQQRLLGSFLPSFARQDEIFARIPTLDLSPLEADNLDLPEATLLASPVLPEPAGESARRLVLAGADLISLQVSRLNDDLWLTARTRGPLLPGLHYRLLIKFPDGRTGVFTWPGLAERLDRTSFGLHLNLSQMGDPPVLGFAVEVRQQATLDRSGWHFVILRNTL